MKERAREKEGREGKRKGGSPSLFEALRMVPIFFAYMFT